MADAAELVVAYDLARDREVVERVQMATVQGSEVALTTEHGLLGSKTWWEAVRDGAIPTRVAEGKIARLYRNAAGWPEFELTTPDGVSAWSLDGDVARYRAGRRARVEYVVQRYQKPLPGSGDRETRVVIRIRVEP